jgi:hypothetical protein
MRRIVTTLLFILALALSAAANLGLPWGPPAPP